MNTMYSDIRGEPTQPNEGFPNPTQVTDQMVKTYQRCYGVSATPEETKKILQQQLDEIEKDIKEKKDYGLELALSKKMIFLFNLIENQNDQFKLLVTNLENLLLEYKKRHLKNTSGETVEAAINALKQKIKLGYTDSSSDTALSRLLHMAPPFQDIFTNRYLSALKRIQGNSDLYNEGFKKIYEAYSAIHTDDETQQYLIDQIKKIMSLVV